MRLIHRPLRDFSRRVDENDAAAKMLNLFPVQQVQQQRWLAEVLALPVLREIIRQT